MSAPNARTVIAAGIADPCGRRRAAPALAALKAAAGGGRFIVIDTEGCDGDGTVMGLEQPGAKAGPFVLSPAGLLTSLFPGHPWDENECTPLYVLTQPGDGG